MANESDRFIKHAWELFVGDGQAMFLHSNRDGALVRLVCKDCRAVARCVLEGDDLAAIPPCDALIVRGEPADKPDEPKP